MRAPAWATSEVRGPARFQMGKVNGFWEEEACVPENCSQTNI